jgi:DNA-directed RNA polymerase I, II, and III subunit RPABC2
VLTSQSGDIPDAKQRTGKAAKPNDVRITTPYMTKYERARVLGTRALQIS